MQYIYLNIKQKNWILIETLLWVPSITLIFIKCKVNSERKIWNLLITVNNEKSVKLENNKIYIEIWSGLYILLSSTEIIYKLEKAITQFTYSGTVYLLQTFWGLNFLPFINSFLYLK